jgi:hypothetical protein
LEDYDCQMDLDFWCRTWVYPGNLVVKLCSNALKDDTATADAQEEEVAETVVQDVVVLDDLPTFEPTRRPTMFDDAVSGYGTVHVDTASQKGIADSVLAKTEAIDDERKGQKSQEDFDKYEAGNAKAVAVQANQAFRAVSEGGGAEQGWGTHGPALLGSGYSELPPTRRLRGEAVQDPRMR